MKKFLTLMVATVVALLAVVGLAPTAQAAYPDVVINVTVDKTTVDEGETFTVTATANVDCDWTLEWNGVTKTKAGSSSFVTTFTAPEVTKDTLIPLHATCVYDLPDGATPAARAAAGATTWNRTIGITVLDKTSIVSPPDGDGDGNGPGLPDTGGPMFWLLIAGLVLVVGGTTVTVRSRRRGVQA